MRYIDDPDCHKYLTSEKFVPGLERTVDRDNLFEDVIDTYREGDIVGEYPIFITYKL